MATDFGQLGGPLTPHNPPNPTHGWSPAAAQDVLPSGASVLNVRMQVHLQEQPANSGVHRMRHSMYTA